MAPDTWAAGGPYDAFMGRWSRPVAAEFLRWLDVAPGARWLDVGCGTGALSEQILASARPEAVVGIDPSEGFVAHARERLSDPRADFQVGDAQDLPFDERFGAVVSGLVLNFVPDPSRAAAEMARVAGDGATVAAYVWDYAGGMQMLRHFWDAVAALDPSGARVDEGGRFPIARPEALAELFTEAGLRDVDTGAITAPTRFSGFDDYWQPFLGGQGPAGSHVTSLDEAGREALREHLRSTLPAAGDGSIPLEARAWAVRGVA